MAFYNFGYAITHPMQWLDWSNGKAVMRFIYYGASAELFFVALAAFFLLTIVGVWRNSVLWGVVRGLEWFANTVGRLAAWAGLLMVLQQIVIVFIQRIFLEAQITFGMGVALDKDISWYAEELKFYNALIVCLCAAYTFVQGGHVRVDLVYSVVSYRAKKTIDMFGSGIDHHIGTKRYRIGINRRGKHIVHHHQSAGRMGQFGYGCYINHFERRIRDAFKKYQFGVGGDRLGPSV